MNGSGGFYIPPLFSPQLVRQFLEQ